MMEAWINRAMEILTEPDTEMRYNVWWIARAYEILHEQSV